MPLRGIARNLVLTWRRRAARDILLADSELIELIDDHCESIQLMSNDFLDRRLCDRTGDARRGGRFRHLGGLFGLGLAGFFLVQALLERGYSKEDIEAILAGNLMRVWQAVDAHANRESTGSSG